MPGTRHRRDHDRGYESSGHDAPPWSRGRAQRPRAPLHRSSSYDERYHHHRRRPARRDDGYSDYESYSDDASPPPPPRSSRRRHAKSVGGRPGHRGSRRDRSYSRSPSRRRHYRQEEDDGEFDRRKRDQAIKSALTAGAVEAMRQRNRPGEWMGEKGLRVATAAMDTAVDKDPRKRAKRNVIGSTLGGLFVDKMASGIMGRR